MEIEYVNLRIKKGYGVKKLSKPIKGKDGNNIPGEYMWGNANPTNKQEFGDPPVSDPAKGSHIYWPAQKAALNEHTTCDMMYKVFYTPFYSTYQEVPVATWDVGDDQPSFPYQFMKGDENPFCGLLFDPILMHTDNMDGRPRQLRGNGQHETIPMRQIYWCADDPINMFLENLRNSKDAIMLAAGATSNPMTPNLQDGHGWNYVHPEDSPTIGPVVGKHLVKAAVTDMTDIRSVIREECTNFFIDCGINQNAMCQLVPEHYRQTAARTINVDPEVGLLQDHMHSAYKKMEEIDRRSIQYIQTQGSAEVAITILGRHIKEEFDNIGRNTDRAERQLDILASFSYELECHAIKAGTLPAIEATIEILNKFTTIAHRLELVKHRKTPEINAKAVRFQQFDTDGEGAQLSPNVTIKHRGVMPYCGTSYGLTDMTTITDNIFAPEAERVDNTRQRGRAIKRKETGDVPNPSAPDVVGVGLFKQGTEHRDGMFQCPTDTKFDSKISEGHTHSETLDKIAESIRKLRQTQQALVAEQKEEAQWMPVEDTKSAAASSGTKQDEAPKDPPDSGKVKRAAVEKDGVAGPQPQAKP